MSLIKFYNYKIIIGKKKKVMMQYHTYSCIMCNLFLMEKNIRTIPFNLQNFGSKVVEIVWHCMFILLQIKYGNTGGGGGILEKKQVFVGVFLEIFF